MALAASPPVYKQLWYLHAYILSLWPSAPCFSTQLVQKALSGRSLSNLDGWRACCDQENRLLPNFGQQKTRRKDARSVGAGTTCRPADRCPQAGRAACIGGRSASRPPSSRPEQCSPRRSPGRPTTS